MRHSLVAALGCGLLLASAEKSRADSLTLNDTRLARVQAENNEDYIEFRAFESIDGFGDHLFLIAISNKYGGFSPQLPSDEPLPTSLTGFSQWHALHFGSIDSGTFDSDINADNNGGQLNSLNWAPWANVSLTLSNGLYTLTASGDFDPDANPATFTSFTDATNVLSGAHLDTWNLQFSWTGGETGFEDAGYTAYAVSGYVTINYTNGTNVPPTDPVPEPGTLALLGVGALSVARRARRRFR